MVHVEQRRPASQAKYTGKKPGKNGVLGIVPDQHAVYHLVGELERAGFRADDISALFPDKKTTRDFAYERNTKAPEGAVMGAGAGGFVGGTLGVLAGLGALAIPGIGPLIAAGPIMTGLSGVAAGAVIGGLSGGLIGLGVPEIEAKKLESRVKDGNVLVSIHVDDPGWGKKAESIFRAAGATDIVATKQASRERSSTRPDTSQRHDGSNGSNGSNGAMHGTSVIGHAVPADIRPEMPVVCVDGKQVAIVDHMQGNSSIKLTRDRNGSHHFIPLSWVTHVDEKVHVNRTGAEAVREWSTSPNGSGR